MTIHFKRSFLLFFVFFIQKNFSQNITVNESNTPIQLVENVLLQSSCAAVTNVSVSGGNFSTGELSYGTFDANGSNFPFESGIILSTGKINNAPGPNNSLLEDGGNMGWNGDIDLQNALGISNSYNATILEFDFIPLGNRISFDYILSSEQYLRTATSNQCNFTDGFAFLIKKTTDTNYTNIAVVPGTSIPVKINTVRGPGSVCPPANEQYFDAFNDVVHPTNFNGQTKVLTAQSDVEANVQYHIKLVIADEGNYRYDSAIFLKGGSFNFGVNLGNDRTVANGNPICQTESLTLNATTTGAIQYQWFLNSTLLIGETNPTLTFSPPYNPLTQNGNYTVNVTVGACIVQPKINLDFTPTLNVIKSTFELCDIDALQDGKTEFDLDLIRGQIFSNLPSTYQVDFFESTTSTTPLPNLYTNSVANSQTLFAKITNNTNCAFPIYNINLKVNLFGQTIVNETIGLCDGNTIILNAGNNFTSYSWNTIPTQTTQNISISTPGIYTVTIENGGGCFINKTFNVVLSEPATIIDVLTNDFSNNNTASVMVSGTGNYEFSLDGINYQESNVFYNLDAGEYLVYVQDINGCGLATQQFYILNYPAFFTPNNDGFNDTWQIKNLDKTGFEASKIYIFDRYGKLLKQMSPLGSGWDGTYNGKLQSSSDYWFVLELTNNKTIKGHFALKR